MVSQRYSVAMAETLHYLKGITQDDINKIPQKFMEFLKNNASKEYVCDFDYTKPLKDLELKEETRGLIGMICLNYWCETQEQKNAFMEHLNENERIYQEKLREKYDVNFLSKVNKEEKQQQSNMPNSTETLPTEIKKESLIKNFFKKIISIFK